MMDSYVSQVYLCVSECNEVDWNSNLALQVLIIHILTKHIIILVMTLIPLNLNDLIIEC